jgi:predicted nuclease of predicted toxin-antitoxin system
MDREEIDITRNILSKIRNLQENYKSQSQQLLIENEAKSGNAIAITDDPKFGTNVLSNQIEQFRSQVDSGAQFSEPNENNVSESPLIFVPKTSKTGGTGTKSVSNLIFSGVIPSLKNLKFQFVLQTDSQFGCFVWADSLVLTKDVMETLQKLYGFYMNWREEWNMEVTDLEKMAKAIQED